MKRHEIRAWNCILGVLLALTAGVASAQTLDDIDITPVGNEARVQLSFTAPVRYIRHFPPDSGQIVHVTLQIVTLDDSETTPQEFYMHSPKSDLVPGFTVRYSRLRDCAVQRDPICLVVEFSQPVHYQLQMTPDSRRVLLFVQRPAPKEKTESGTGPARSPQ
jgi:hypothetical protein